VAFGRRGKEREIGRKRGLLGWSDMEPLWLLYLL
jgi:hypothetical protein